MSQQFNQQTVSPPPAGWYPDPSGAAAERYWDGIGWSTEFTRSAPPAPTMMHGGVPGVMQPTPYGAFGGGYNTGSATSSSTPGIVIAGYVCAFVIPLIGLIIAARVSSSHDMSVKVHGNRVALVAVASIVFWIIVRSTG